MKYLILFLLSGSVILGIINGRISDVSNAALSECSNAVTLAVSLCGTICFWSGIMNIAEKSGIVNKITKLLSPVLRLLFKGIDPNGKAMGFILLNLASNLLGLGNAATPIGLKAMDELKKEENANIYATDNMIIFTVLNTASLQIIPTTVIAIRVKYGSASPTEILPCVWIVSIIALTVSILTAKILEKFTRRRNK